MAEKALANVKCPRCGEVVPLFEGEYVSVYCGPGADGKVVEWCGHPVRRPEPVEGGQS